MYSFGHSGKLARAIAIDSRHHSYVASEIEENRSEGKIGVWNSKIKFSACT